MDGNNLYEVFNLKWLGMKKYLIVLCVCLFVACVNNNDFDESPITLTSEQCDSILAVFLTTEDDLYCLSISQEEVLKQGIPIEEYERFYQLMDDVNKTLIDAKEEGIPIYGMGSRDSLLSRVPEQHPQYNIPLYTAKLPDGHSETYSFQGSGAIVVVGGADAPLWSISFKNLTRGGKFILTGGYGRPSQEVLDGYNLVDTYVNWKWEVQKLAGDNCNAFCSFWGINCLGVEGILPLGVLLEVYKCDRTNYTIRIKREWGVNIRLEIYDGTSKISGPTELAWGRELQVAGFAYSRYYRLKFFDTSGFEISSVDFFMYSK